MCSEKEFSERPLFLALSFFEDHVLAGLRVVLLELDLAGDKLLVLARPVHLSGTFCLQLYELILGHDSQLLVSS